jgi:hypothetical protein
MHVSFFEAIHTRRPGMDQFERDYNRNLQQRREKLNRLLSTETTGYCIEISHQQAAKIVRQKEAKAQKLLTATLARERNDREYAERMRNEVRLDNCDDLRPRLSQQLTIEAKGYQRYQIEEKEARRKVTAKCDLMWHEVAQQRLAEEQALRALNVKEMALRNHCIADELWHQMVAKKAADEKMRQN